MLIFECLFGSMKMQKIESKIGHSQKGIFACAVLSKFLGVVLWILFSILNCTNQRDYCMESVSRKGLLFSGSAKSVCIGSLANQNFANVAEANGQSSRFDRWISDQSLINCLYKTIEERKCKNESVYIPHFGY